MHSLIGDRFLKQFFGSRLHRRRVNPASEAGSPMENEGDKPTEPGYLPGEDLLENEATLENKKTGEVNKLSGPEDGSVQPASQIPLLASDDQKE
jgi:hypothetical protein